MRLKGILLGQSVRFLGLLEPHGGIYAPDFLKAIQEQYSFVTVPKSLEEFDRNKGINFGHGKFTLPGGEKLAALRSIVIDRLQIYVNGIVAETRGSVEDVDLFVDDLIEWSIRTFGTQIDPSVPIVSRYLSNVEVEMQNPLVKFRQQGLELIAKSLSKKFTAYGVEVPLFELTRFTLHTDSTALKVPNPTQFRLERREGFEFGANVFFSSAALKTGDHLELLEAIESQP